MKPASIIAPYDAMWRETGCLFRALELGRAGLEESVLGLSAAALGAKPLAGASSIASLLVACGAEEASWIHERWRKNAVPKAPAESAGPDAILGWMREVREATRLALIKATDADLDRRTIQDGGGGASLRYALHHLVDGMAFARGQITLLRALGK